MTMTDDRRFLYPDLNDKDTEVVDAAYDAVSEVFKDHEVAAAGDDRAEALVGAIARYLVDSRQEPTPWSRGDFKDVDNCPPVDYIGPN